MCLTANHSAGRPFTCLLSDVAGRADFLESISIATALARKHKYTINVTQELLAIGTCNLAGSAFSASTATGSFSRSSVTSDIGAKSPLHGMVTGASSAAA